MISRGLEKVNVKVVFGIEIMNNKRIQVLKSLTKSARSGCAEVDIIDLMYETSLPYTDLKNILDDLIVQNEVEDINVKTYKFIGSIDREFVEVGGEAADTVCEDDALDEDEGEDIDEDEMWRKRHEYLERRRRELIAKIESIAKEEECSDDKDSKEDKEEEDSLFEDFDDNDNDDDGELIKSYDSEDDVNNVSEDTASQFDSILDEESLKKRLLDFMSDGGEISRLAIKALKLCVAERYITDWLLQRELRMNDVELKYVRDILYRNNFIKCDCDPNKYILAVPEGLVYACFQETEERKSAFGDLINVLKNIGEQKRRKNPQTKTSTCKYVNNFQLKKTVRQKLLDLLRIDPKITRTKAIIKAEGCLFAARDIGDEYAKYVFEKVLEELTDMSDYLFNRLKSDVQD